MHPEIGKQMINNVNNGRWVKTNSRNLLFGGGINHVWKKFQTRVCKSKKYVKVTHKAGNVTIMSAILTRQELFALETTLERRKKKTSALKSAYQKNTRPR